MSATETVHNYLAGMRRSPGETDESFAIRLYDMQMEIYSAHAGRDLDAPFFTLPKKVQQGWIKAAQDHVSSRPASR